MRNKLYYENRIAKLKAKGEVRNSALIAKAQRRLRQLEQNKQNEQIGKLTEAVSASAAAFNKVSSALASYAEEMDSLVKKVVNTITDVFSPA